MRKRFVLFLCLAVCLAFLCACGKNTASVRRDSTTDSIVEQIAAAEKEKAAQEPFILPDPDAGLPEETEEPSGTPSPDVDIDLTVLNSQMVYAQVSDMMDNPDDYIGKTVRMKGTLAFVEDDGVMYFACFIKDAQQCCQQGIEFVRSGDYVFPDDYPELNAPIMVEGTFTVYEDDGEQYASLFDATMTVL